jgi:predicted phage-related endonuclease
MRSGQNPEVELWVTELASGKIEPALPGSTVESRFTSGNYAVSRDEKRIVFAKKRQNGISHLWLA